jgi:hypothetical protein
MFCGDGSRADYTPNEGKGISLHTQGFTSEENNLIANAIYDLVNLEAEVLYTH